MENKESVIKKNLKSKNIYQMEEAYLKNPEDLDIKYAYANLLLEFGVEKQILGIELLLELLKTRYKDRALISLAYFEYSNGNFKNAKDIYEQLINKVKKLRDYESLKYYFLKLDGDETKKDDMIFFNALLSEDLDYNDLAISFYRKLLKTEKRNNALLKIAHIERKENKYYKCKGHLLGILRNPNNGNDVIHALYEFGKLEYQFENFDNAIRDFEKILNSRNIKYQNMARLELANIMFTQKKFDEAEKYLLDGIKTNNDLRVLYEKLLILYIKTNKIEKSKDLLDDLVKKNIKIDKRVIALVCYYTGIPYGELIEKEDDYILNQIEGYDLIETLKNCEMDVSIDSIKKFLTDRYKICKLTLFDEYLIPGSDIGENYEYLKVLTIPNTQNIIMSYPVNNKYIEDSKSKELNTPNRVNYYKHSKEKVFKI